MKLLAPTAVGDIFAIATNVNSDLMAVSMRAGVLLLDTNTFAEVAAIPTPLGAMVSLAMVSGRELLGVDSAGNCQLFELHTFQQTAVCPVARGAEVSRIVVYPDGRRVLFLTCDKQKRSSVCALLIANGTLSPCKTKPLDARINRLAILGNETIVYSRDGESLDVFAEDLFP
jgi:hypothetical protein